VLLLVHLAIPAVWADPGDVAIAGKTGTLGLGGELTVNLLTDVNVRLGATWFDLDFDGEASDIDYDVDLDLLAFPIMLDWYVFDDAFHLSAGVLFNETDFGLDGRFSGTIEIGDNTYTFDEVGTLSGDLGWDDVAPYVGIGWGNAFGQDRRWGFLSDLGVAFVGSPEVALSATGTLAGDPGFQADLAREEADLEDDLSDFKVYPVLSVSLFYRF
jgi:hypothetical protein